MEENNNTKVTNKFAVASLVVSLVGILFAGGPCGIAAVITGIIGLVKFNPETEKGKGMAIAGIIIGAIDFILVLIYTIMRATLKV